MIHTDRKTLELISSDVEIGSDVSDLIDTMKHEMIKNKGIGIAAIQVGDPKRVIIINTAKCQLVLINPELSEGKYTKVSKEGCLSVPNKNVKVNRFNHVVVSGYDENWNKVNKKLKALSAFVAQHEVDHLNGITI